VPYPQTSSHWFPLPGPPPDSLKPWTDALNHHLLAGHAAGQQFVLIVDEAQNLEPTTLKTILTRIGDGTKVIFTGDTSQIDAPYLGESNNALAVLIQAFGGQRCFGHVTLSACERSAVASLAAELL